MPRSIIGADIGSTLTHVCLVERVEGSYRFVARAEVPTTSGHPENDVMIGLSRAIQRLEEISQRQLLDESEDVVTPEEESGVGVDAFVATSNAAGPVQCVIVGLTNDLSVQSADRACSATNVEVIQTISLSRRMRRWDNRALATLHRTPPDLILLVGGADTGPVAPVRNAAEVLATVYREVSREERPIVIYAGNQEARRPVSEVMSAGFDFRVVENVRPDVETENLIELQRELTSVYERAKLSTLPGYRRLRQWCTSPLLSTPRALGTVLRYIARRNDLGQGVLGLDVGGATTYVGTARGQDYRWTLSSDLGSSYGIRETLQRSGLGGIRRWLPVSVADGETASRLENARLRPQSIPQTMEELLLVHAVARQALLLTMREMRKRYWQQGEAEQEYGVPPLFDIVAARGGAIAHTPQDGIIALTLLDAVQPVGLSRIVIDWASMWPQLGALAAVAPDAAAQVLERDGFRELGTVIAPIGEARDGERAIRLTIVREDGPTTEVDIPAGMIWRFPLALEESAIVEVRPSHEFDIGMGRKGMAGKASVRGGSLGIIVDTRGRPLSLPRNAFRRREKLQEWLENLIGDVKNSS